jgi:hemoglobin
MQSTKSTTLYERAGGFVGIAAVVDDFVERLFADPRIASRVEGNGHEAKRNLRLLTVDLLCAASGAPGFPQPRIRQSGAERLGMTETEWEQTLTHLEDALSRGGISPSDRDTLFSRIAPEQPAGSLKAAEPSPLRHTTAPLVVRLAAQARTVGSSLQHARTG